MADKLITVDVTQEDIDKGEEGLCFSCPISLALYRATGSAIWVGKNRISSSYKGPWSRELPAVAVRFIEQFDFDVGIASPFSFQISIPEEYCREVA